MSESFFTSDVSVPGAAHLRPTDPREFRQVVENRRSVRKFDGSAVPEAVMRDALDLALLAPNSSNLQAWEFYWVRSPEKKAKLVEYCFSQNAARTATELVVAVGRIDKVFTRRKQILAQLDARNQAVPQVLRDYYQKLVPLAYGRGPLSLFAPIKWLVLNTVGLFRPTPREPIGKSDLRLWAAKSTALACENFMLAISAHGFDTCPMEGLDSRRVQKLLGLPRCSVVVMAIGVGRRRADGVYGPRLRLPSAEFIREL
jgi:nitroreductase